MTAAGADSPSPQERAPVREVAVLRALMLGDLLCTTPALRALRHGLPDARIHLIGLPWARGLAERLDSVDAFIEFPGWPGLPEAPVPDTRRQAQFLADMRERRFDLAVQLHGSGPIVNPLLAAFGAARNAGFFSPEQDGAQAQVGDGAGFIPWPQSGTEVERLLQLTDHLGLPRRGTRLDFPLRQADRDAAAQLVPGGPDQRLALIHPGSQLPSRRWPAERFAAVADALADAGLQVLLTGSAAEAGLTQRVTGAMLTHATDLAGRTTLWTLGALVERAAVLVSNDTGVSHVAAALGTPSVIVSSGGDMRRWAPADAQRHRVFWRDLPCRPCSQAECLIGHACALAVTVDEVRQAALQAIETSPPASHRESPR